jgi:hypothetical protein
LEVSVQQCPRFTEDLEDLLFGKFHGNGWDGVGDR